MRRLPRSLTLRHWVEQCFTHMAKRQLQQRLSVPMATPLCATGKELHSFSPHQEQVWQWAWPGIVQSTDWSRTKYTPSPKEGKLSLSKDICPAQAMWALYIFVRKWSGPKAHFPGTMQGWERRHACVWLYQEGVCHLRHEINRKESYSSHGIQPTSRLYILMNLYIQVSGGFFFFLIFQKCIPLWT